MKAEDIRKMVMEYIDMEESFGDDAQLKVKLPSEEMEIVDEADEEEGADFWPMMDLVAMSEDEPGKWVPDDDAISQVAEEYNQ